jgi:hypothetical protein
VVDEAVLVVDEAVLVVDEDVLVVDEVVLVIKKAVPAVITGFLVVYVDVQLIFLSTIARWNLHLQTPPSPPPPKSDINLSSGADDCIFLVLYKAHLYSMNEGLTLVMRVI